MCLFDIAMGLEELVNWLEETEDFLSNSDNFGTPHGSGGTMLAITGWWLNILQSRQTQGSQSSQNTRDGSEHYDDEDQLEQELEGVHNRDTFLACLAMAFTTNKTTSFIAMHRQEIKNQCTRWLLQNNLLMHEYAALNPSNITKWFNENADKISERFAIS